MRDYGRKGVSSERHGVVDLGRSSKSAICRQERNLASICQEGVEFFEAGKLKEAEDAFEEAIRLAPASPEGYVGLARVQSRLGREELATLLRARARQLGEAEEGQPPEGARDGQMDGTRGVTAPGAEMPGERPGSPARKSGRTGRHGRTGRTARTGVRAFRIAATAGALCGLAVMGLVAVNPPVGLVGTRLVSQAELRREIHAVVQGLQPAPPREPMLSELDWETWLVRHNPPLQHFVSMELRRREALRGLARERNRIVGSRELEATLRKLRASPAWRQISQERGWDAEDWRRLAEVVALEEALLASWPGAERPSEGDVEAYYRRNKARFVDQEGRILPLAEVAPYLRKQLSLDRRFAGLQGAIRQRAEHIPIHFWIQLAE